MGKLFREIKGKLFYIWQKEVGSRYLPSVMIHAWIHIRLAMFVL